MYKLVIRDRFTPDACPIIMTYRTQELAISAAAAEVAWESCKRVWVLDKMGSVVFEEDGSFAWLDNLEEVE